MDIKLQIFKELDALENGVAKLQDKARNAGQQTDLEVAILTEQVKTLRQNASAADALVVRAIEVLKNIPA